MDPLLDSLPMDSPFRHWRQNLPNRMDVCYFLGSESAVDDWELRYSLRSWLANYRGLDRFHIVGHLPAWLRIGAEVVHHPFPDAYRSNKDANLIQKTIYLASLPEVSDPFVLCSDDQMLLRPAVQAEMLPPSHAGPIESHKRVRGHSWWERLHRTSDALKRRRKPAFHFDTHIPHVVTKDQARSLLQWNYGESGGYCVFSLLYNGSNTAGAPIGRAPIRAGLYGASWGPGDVAAKMEKNLFLSLDTDSIKCPHIVRAVEERWPVAAPWEIYPPRSPLQYTTLFPEPVDEPPVQPSSPAFDYTQYLIA